MTTTDSGPADEVTLEEYVEPTGPRRRRPAPRANPFFRFVFPLIIVGLGVWVFLLWREGTKAVLDSTDGTLVAVVTDPDAPGYEVFVDPTPTLLLLHTDGDELVGITVMARTLLDNGGQAVLVGPDLAADGTSGETLGARFDRAGADAVEEAVGTLFGFGFLERTVLDTSELGPLLALAEPLSIALADDLITVAADGTADVWLASGGQRLDGPTAAELYAFRNPGEFPANRTSRQLDVWESWLLALDEVDDLTAATLAFEEGVSPYLRAFVTGRSELALLPAVPDLSTGTPPESVLDDRAREWIADLAEVMVPLPVSPIGSTLPRIRLLDGTGEPGVREAALDAVADLSEVVVFGNAAEFGVEATIVTYYQEADEAPARTLADALGAAVEFSPAPDQPVDLTVTIGTDWETP